MLSWHCKGPATGIPWPDTPVKGSQPFFESNPFSMVLCTSRTDGGNFASKCHSTFEQRPFLGLREVARPVVLGCLFAPFH